MNTATQTPRLESDKVRLIDANALIEAIMQEVNDSHARDEAIREIESAPTVETTDEVFARLPERGFIWKRNNKEYWAWEMYENSNWDVSIDFPQIGENPIEAVKNLESSLKQK